MFKSLKGAASLVLIAASLYAGSASAAISLPSSLTIPVPGVLTLTLGGIPPTISLNLFPTLKTTSPIIGLSLFGKPTLNVAVGPVPEPEIFAMMGLGLAMVGFAARRRKAK